VLDVGFDGVDKDSGVWKGWNGTRWIPPSYVVRLHGWVLILLLLLLRCLGRSAEKAR